MRKSHERGKAVKRTTILLAAALALAGGVCCAAWRADMWQRHVTLREGVTMKALTLENPRLIKAYMVKIDLTTPGIGFTATERDKNWGDPMPDYTNKVRIIDTKREKTADFMTRRRSAGRNVEVAVNTSPWGPWEHPFTHTYGAFRNWNVSDGVNISHVDAPKKGAFFLVRKDGLVDIVGEIPVAETNQIAISMYGFQLIMTNGVPAFASRKKHGSLAPRTAIGLTPDKKTLVLLAVDGRQEGYSLGADLKDLYNILKKEGVSDALNMDGGGSTSLVVFDREKKRPVMLNHQPHGSVRKVALNLGITFDEKNALSTTSLDGEGWKFARDTTKEASLDASAPEFDDSSWSDVEVPHDWAIEGPFDPALSGGTGKLPWRGVGWYRRKFEVTPGEYAKIAAGSALWLEFDGVMADGKVYVNGKAAGGGQYGYLGFRVDVALFVKPGANTIAVRADTRSHHSRWYPGAGIYRSVRLVHAPAVHVLPGSAFVTTPVVAKESATVHVEFAVTNRLAKSVDVKAGLCIDWCGNSSAHKLGSHAAKAIERRSIAAGAVERFAFDVKVANPQLWDVENPSLYYASIAVSSGANDGETDVERVRFGIRTAEFTADDGFHLNGRRVQIKGVDLHSDLGPLGMAFSRSAMRRQLEIMKDMGANALRTSHNAPAPQLLELCDEMGIVVWNECFDKWDGTAGLRKDQDMEAYVEANLREFVLRDRNHPSVVAWSIGNEIQPYIEGSKWRTRKDGMTAARFRRFRGAIRELDATRPVGIGCCDVHAVPTGMFADLDISGWNYGAKYRNVKEKHPNKPVLYTESASAVSSYGHYEMPPAPHKTAFDSDVREVSGYEHNAVPWGDIADVEFARMESDRYCGGEFVWTGIDYLGEPTPYNNESRSSYFGICDLMAFPKDRYWLYRSHWNEKAHTLHIAPHWNWEGREGRNVPVYVYTDGDEAELFLTGKSLGRRKKGEVQCAAGQSDGEKFRSNKYYDVCDRYRLRWLDVPYQPGELKAVAYKAGKKIGEKTMRTAGSQAAVRLTREGRWMPDYGDYERLSFVQVEVVDADGTPDPIAANRVKFKIEGPGRILAVGNGDARAMESFKKVDSHPLYNGRALVVVRREKGGKGQIKLTASADGLEPAEIVITDF
jgi:beta-galactosidase